MEQGYKMDNYRKESVFAGFLPGISGITGIPIWCYYVNRGQCISCFGSMDKDHSIMEFLTAQQAYVQTPRTGYRTFLKVNGDYTEAFSIDENPHAMYVGQNTLSIEETDVTHQLKTQVTYFTLPEERLGGLVRMLTIENLSKKKVHLEVLDGCPMLVPYGVGLDSLKNMTQTAKAWMQVEDTEQKRAFFRVRASMADSAKVVAIQEGNFSIAADEKGNRLMPIVDFEKVFGYDTSFGVAHGFIEHGIKLYENQMTMNRIPCCFYGMERDLAAGESIRLFQITGQASSKEVFHQFERQQFTEEYFEEKLRTARALTEEITRAMETKTANPMFDQYCRQDFLDNVLRGGMPISLGNHMFYVYHRKHGDMERDYNYFKLLPEFFSQGNGNYRDINQNRRCDAFFFPEVMDQNIHMFYDFIQLDGYNPLGVEKTTFCLRENQLSEAAAVWGVEQDDVKDFRKPFTPGQAAQKLTKLSPTASAAEIAEKTGQLLSLSEKQNCGNFGEGYWCDHWTYNLDLIESFLSIHPELEHHLFFEDKSYTYFRAGAGIFPRTKRYEEVNGKIYQYHSVYPLLNQENQVYTCDKNGKVIYTTLIEKMILLNLLKFATLDSAGCGMEMEGGKPGWYDALNGLPGLLGSSMPETCELARNLEFTLNVLKAGDDVELLQEIYTLMQEMKHILEQTSVTETSDYFPVWDAMNDVKEAYREKLYSGVSGVYQTVKAEEISVFLQTLLDIVRIGIKKAIEAGKGLIPTYFYYEVTEYEKTREGITAKAFRQHVLPYFLEGPVHYLKLSLPQDIKRQVYQRVKASGLYDGKLCMYKVNEPITNESFELGRCRAFTPGWLENESIWLHMEYKYLLELLKSGLYKEFIEDFHHACIPFLDAKTYGRSPLENSSFLASSANPDTKIHGKGFVARLSGSTVEFMDMWQRMMFGNAPFSLKEDGLTFELSPVLPEYLLGEGCMVEATFLGKIKVIYHVKKEGRDYYPGKYKVTEYALSSGKIPVTHIYADKIVGSLAEDIRNQKITKMDVYLEA